MLERKPQQPPNPLAFALAFQSAMFESWAVGLRVWMQMCEHAAHANHRLLEPHQWHRWHDCCFRGADLQDHYGRRSHDVDVERI